MTCTKYTPYHNELFISPYQLPLPQTNHTALVCAYFEMLAIPDSPAGGTRSPLDKHAQICYSVIVPDNDNRKPSKGFSL